MICYIVDSEKMVGWTCYICFYFIFLSLSMFSFLFFFFNIFVHPLDTPYSTDHSTLRQTEICSTHITNFFFLFLQFNYWKQSTLFPSCFIHIFFESWGFVTVTFSVIWKCFCILKCFSFILGRILLITWEKCLLYILFT